MDQLNAGDQHNHAADVSQISALSGHS